MLPRRANRVILIAVIWMLILVSAIVAVLMLRGMSRAVDANAAGQALTQKLLAEGTVTIGRKQIQMQVSSESGRLDINEASLELIDRALIRLGVEAGERRVVLDRLGAHRGGEAGYLVL